MMIVGRVLGVLGCGPAPGADVVEIAVLLIGWRCCAGRYRVRGTRRWIGWCWPGW